MATCKVRWATHNRVKLGQDHAINTPRFALCTRTSGRRRRRKVSQGSVEFGQLVNGFVAYERFSNKDDLVWRVDSDKL